MTDEPTMTVIIDGQEAQRPCYEVAVEINLYGHCGYRHEKRPLLKPGEDFFRDTEGKVHILTTQPK